MEDGQVMRWKWDDAAAESKAKLSSGDDFSLACYGVEDEDLSNVVRSSWLESLMTPVPVVGDVPTDQGRFVLGIVWQVKKRERRAKTRTGSRFSIFPKSSSSLVDIEKKKTFSLSLVRVASNAGHPITSKAHPSTKGREKSRHGDRRFQVFFEFPTSFYYFFFKARIL